MTGAAARFLPWCARSAKRLLAAFRRDTKGNATMIAGIGVFAFMGAAALSVDTSSFYVTKRKLQRTTDLAALAAAADITNATKAANATLSANGLAGSLTNLTLGVYTPDPTLAAGARFTATNVTPNAVRLTTSTQTAMIFGVLFAGAQANPSSKTVSIGAGATAIPSAIASFSIGSRVASFDPPVANAILGGLLGVNLSLSAGSYTSLLSTNIDMGVFARALGSNLNLQVATYGDLLAASIPLSGALQVLQATPGGSASASAVSAVAVATGNGTSTIKLGQLIDFGPYDSYPISATLPISPKMSAYDIVSGFAEVANGTKEVATDLGILIPGLADANVDLMIGSKPVSTTEGRPGSSTQVTTTQIRLKVTTTINVAGLASLNLPIIVDVGRATATFQSLTCPPGQPANASLSLGVTPAIGGLYIGTAATTSPSVPLPTIQPGPIATIAGISLFASAAVTASNTQPTTVSFTPADVTAGTVKTVTTTTPLSTLASSLLSTLTVSVGTGQGGLNLPILGGVSSSVLANTVKVALQGTATPTDTLLEELLRILGVGLGQADVWSTDIRCGAAVLVQ